MELTITAVDYAPQELDEQLPLVVDLTRVAHHVRGSGPPCVWEAELEGRWRALHYSLRNYRLIDACSLFAPIYCRLFSKPGGNS